MCGGHLLDCLDQLPIFVCFHQTCRKMLLNNFLAILSYGPLTGFFLICVHHFFTAFLYHAFWKTLDDSGHLELLMCFQMKYKILLKTAARVKTPERS